MTTPIIASTAPMPTANDLRRLAEKADGMRNTEVCLVDVGTHYDVLPRADVRVGSRVVLTLNTPQIGVNLTGASFDLRFGGNSYTNPNVDAIFLSQSALEKFVIPYYARFLVPSELDAMKTDILVTNRDVFAVVHEWPTVYATIPSRRLPAGLSALMHATGVAPRVI